MYTPFKMKGKSPMMKALVGKQNNLPAGLKAKIEASPARKDKKYDKATMKSVTGDKWDDKHKNKQSEMSYTDDFANKSFKDLKSNYTTGKTYKQKDRENNYENADVVRAYRDQQKNVKKGMDSLGNPIKMKKASPTKMYGKKSPAKKRVVGTDADGNKTVSRVNKKGVTRKTKTFKNAPGVTKAGKVEKFRKDGSSKKKVVKGAKKNTITKTNKKGVSKTKVKNNLKTKVKNTGKALGNAGKAVGRGIKSIPKHLDNLGYSLGASAIAGKAMMSAAFPPVAATAAIGTGMVVANEIGKGVRNKIKTNKANKKARKEAGIDKKGNPITMKKKSPTKNYKKGYYGA